MITSQISKEFIGRFLAFYKDGESVYAYDEITHGLYKFTLGLRKVDLVIPPENIHKYTKDIITGISKRGDEIILIPQFVDEKWIFYDEKEKKIRYEKVVKSKVCMIDVITIASNLFIIPLNAYEPIIIVSLDSLNIIKIFENWDKNNIGEIWCASTYGDLVLFSVAGSEKIVSVNCNEINMIKPNIADPIFSISIYKEKIWILPTLGDYIYSIDFNGDVVDRIQLPNTDLKISAKEFCRIIAVEDTIFLLPLYDKKIYAYQLKRKELVEIKPEGIILEGCLLERVTVPYWEFLIEKGILYFLPFEYRYMTIDISSLESKEYALQYGNNINSREYMKMIGGIKIDSFAEKRKNDMRNFFQYLIVLRENSIKEKNENIGRKIWANIMDKDL